MKWMQSRSESDSFEIQSDQHLVSLNRLLLQMLLQTQACGTGFLVLA
jgi:hypothetical protein